MSSIFLLLFSILVISIRANNVLQRDIRKLSEENIKQISQDSENLKSLLKESENNNRFKFDKIFVDLKNLQKTNKYIITEKIEQKINNTEDYIQKCVRIEIFDMITKEEDSSGSGVIVGQDASSIYVLTCDHVIRNYYSSISKDIKIQFPIITKSNNTYKIDYKNKIPSIVGNHPQLDLALLKVPKLNDDCLPIQIANSSEIHEPIFRIGYPSLAEIFFVTGFLSSNRYPVQGTSRLWIHDKVWIASIPVYFGDSGAPIISLRNGKLIGITTGTVDKRYQRICVIIPYPVIREWLMSIKMDKVILNEY